MCILTKTHVHSFTPNTPHKPWLDIHVYTSLKNNIIGELIRKLCFTFFIQNGINIIPCCFSTLYMKHVTNLNLGDVVSPL